VDIRGKTITTFILMEVLHTMSTMREGEVIELITEPLEAIDSDVGAWCRMTGQTLVGIHKEATTHRFHVRKGAEIEVHARDLAMIISNPGLEELLSPLGFALAAALSGRRVHLYFQGPAVRVLTTGFKATLHGLGRPFSRFARKGLAKAGHIAPQEKLRQLKELGAQFYICGPSMEHFGVTPSDLIFADVKVGAYLTFMEVMGDADIRFFLQ
jgi:predicted peroxiredoxin/TusA-related sulfurtransferase